MICKFTLPSSFSPGYSYFLSKTCPWDEIAIIVVRFGCRACGLVGQCIHGVISLARRIFVVDRRQCQIHVKNQKGVFRSFRLRKRIRSSDFIINMLTCILKDGFLAMPKFKHYPLVTLIRKRFSKAVLPSLKREDCSED